MLRLRTLNIHSGLPCFSLSWLYKSSDATNDVLGNTKSVAGSSVGALDTGLPSCGADFEYIKEIAVGMAQCFTHSKFDFLTLLRKGGNMAISYGIYKTENLRTYIKKCNMTSMHIN